jgi:type IX secretion system PorP/SprF family membrane protein
MIKRSAIGDVLLLLIFFLLNGFILCGQQLTPFTLYRDHWNLINPASVSNNNMLAEYPFTVSASTRFQYLGIDIKEAPHTNVLNAEWINDNLNSTFGLQLISDKIGLLGNNGAYLQYAYKLRLSRREERFLSFGISAGAVNYYSKINGADFPIAEPDITPTSTYLPDLNIGIFYRNSDKYYLGISFPQFMNLTAKFKSINTEKEIFSIKRLRHIYAVGGVYIPFNFFGLGDETAILDLSSWVRYLPGQLPVIDGNIRYQHNQTFWFGAGISSNAISHFEVGFLAGKTIGLFDNQIKISIAYDVPIGKAIFQLGSSIEASIAYSWY